MTALVRPAVFVAAVLLVTALVSMPSEHNPAPHCSPSVPVAASPSVLVAAPVPAGTPPKCRGEL